MSASTELNRQTEQEIMDYLLTLAEAGRELVAGLKKIPVAYDPRTGDDPQPFVDLDTGHRYPPRQVYAALVKSGRS